MTEDVGEAELKAQLQYPNNGLSVEDNAFLESFSPQQRKKAVRKVDVRLIPLLGLYYLFSYLDRANIGQFGLQILQTCHPCSADEEKATPRLKG